ncbi:MAG: fumarylacetoacetate hydrolase family protein [Spongiibacteraceae bacterium]
MSYKHRHSDGSSFSFPVGKVVCVGRNYAAHARELNNAIPKFPLLFMKPATAIVDMGQPFFLPERGGSCHHELELALLIGEPLSAAQPATSLAAVAGVGLALDLTLRELQDSLKEKGQPWERAKAFDGACPLSAFIPYAADMDFSTFSLTLQRNNQLQQHGRCSDMLFSVQELLSEISHSFTLMPGDVVLTGTPAGVGPLLHDDELHASLNIGDDEVLQVETSVL